MKDAVTPIRAQYLNIKKQHPEAIVLFRLGDFYETFDEDARIASRELDLVLTSRGMGKNIQVPMAGLPYHALDDYLGKLIKRGYKVAICEQLTKPGDTKGLVGRDVIRVVTPGTVIEPALLENKANNYLACIAIEGEQAGLAYIDITTSEFACAQMPISRLRGELDRLKPAEIVAIEGSENDAPLIDKSITELAPRWFALDITELTLMEHFGVSTLEGYGCARLPQAIRAAGAVLHYLETTQKQALEQITRLSTYSTETFMTMDSISCDNLEIFRGLASGGPAGSLLGVLDATRTPMGGRLLRRWLGQPLLDLVELTRRQEAVTWFFQNSLTRQEIIAVLNKVADLERLANRIRAGVAIPRELIALKNSLDAVPQLVVLLAGDPAWMAKGLAPRSELVELISQAIEEQSTTSLGEGGVIKRGFSPELDNLRSSARDSREFLAGLERQEREQTGIKSLKIGFNNVFGYYIEVSQANISQVPQHYIRKQTLAGCERYYTPELKERESIILNARERMAELETDLFRQVCRQIAMSAEQILALAAVLAELDVFSSLGEIALRNGYTRPLLNTGDAIDIKGGRHPVVERSLPAGEYVSNDLVLSNHDARIIVLTGPNMAGKSTYLKQAAIIVLMAQMGSYVPADKCTIGLVDRIFTRIGAREDLSAGKSTFMVEMVETAGILNNATPRSLLILDEIGRGTSTYDGLAIAQAVVEFIHNSPSLGAKTLFATHYHELVAVAGYLPGVRNFNVAVSEDRGEVVFLHKIVPGGVDKSYGIHVARLAGLPRQVIKRAGEVLSELENHDEPRVVGVSRTPANCPAPQLSFLLPQDKIAAELDRLEIDSLTPLEALTKLYELQKKARNS
jgi:DNA mismatch repair protein MutS